MNAELLHYGESVFTAGREFTERTPSYWTIEYIIAGRVRSIVNRTALTILPGHLAVIPPGAERRKRYTRGTRSVWFHAVLMPPAGEALIRVAPHDEIGHLVEACRLLIAKRETASLEAVLAALLTAVSARAPMTDARLLPVLSYIHANMHRPMRIPALAELAGVSRYHFMEIFRKNIGRPVMQYVGEVRASHAASLIACGAAIRRAAARVGFSDEKAFSRSFKRWTGVSPAEYRRRRILPAITVPRSGAVFQSWRMNDGTPAQGRLPVLHLSHTGSTLLLIIEERIAHAPVTTANIWDGDDWEFFFAMDRTGPYFQACAAADGRTAFYTPSGRDAFCELTSTAAQGIWRLSLRVRLRRILPARTGVIYANVFRQTDAGTLALSPTFSPSLHRSERMAAVTLS